MGSATLVANEIQLGRQVVAQLDKADLRPRVALWMSTPEYDEGRLVLAAPEYDRKEPLKAYEAIYRALPERAVNGRPAVLLLKMRDPFIKALRAIFNRTSTEGMLLGSQRIGNRFIDDGYVYRIT
jgi:hypothetical protein